jgi:hypothetical protein
MNQSQVNNYLEHLTRSLSESSGDLRQAAIDLYHQLWFHLNGCDSTSLISSETVASIAVFLIEELALHLGTSFPMWLDTKNILLVLTRVREAEKVQAELLMSLPQSDANIDSALMFLSSDQRSQLRDRLLAIEEREEISRVEQSLG